MRRGSIQGLNVTVPHKENIISLLDMLSPAAVAIGAVNTVFMRSSKLIGDNTDAPGFWTDLCAGLHVQRFDSLNALILGAGGSARAIIFALLTQGWSVTVAARNRAQASKLCEQLSLPENPIAAIALQGSTIAKLPFLPSLIVNCTPVGMFPNNEFSPWPKGVPLPQGAALYDLIYNPRETLLVRQAIQSGMAATTGLGMLVEQAALSLEHWIDVKAPRAVMHAALAE
jgi:shikimate dehydrogenase